MLRTLLNPRNLIPGVLLFFSFHAALAQVGIGVAPPRFELVLAPGESTTENAAVFSKNTPDQQITVSIVDWTSRPDGSLVALEPGSVPYSASHWILANLDPFTLERDGAHSIRFTVSAPADPNLEGSYWAALAFTTEPRPVNRKGIVALMRTRALVIVYVTVQGTEQPAAELQGVTVVTGEEDGKRFLVADVANSGNVYLRLNGELRFVDTAGEVVRRVPLPERVLLREGLVRYRLPFPEDLPQGAILAQVEIQPQGPAGGYGGPPLYGEVALP
ncbi:hypothetical protein [Oceanithermus sp.]|uniref:hypothetical protein n=1 Tax=Oceanithermus sp. TaxID=2268145 RepID=UPI00257DDD2D|nr:hypothetical protein [Oceanithermus sp.]